MPAERSSAVTSAPFFANAAELVPVPAAMSSTFSPGCGSTARTVATRHSGALPAERMSFVRSYFAATSSNMAATSSGRLFRSALLTRPILEVRTRAFP